MQKKDLVKIINEILRDPWSDADVRQGKDLKCMPAWIASLKEVIPMYEDRGWLVQKNLIITGKSRHLSLNFKHPKWSEKIKK